MKYQVCATAIVTVLMGCSGKESIQLDSVVTERLQDESRQSQEPAVDAASNNAEARQANPPTIPTISLRSEPTMKQDKAAIKKVARTEAEWRTILSPEEYRILRQKGTERAYTGKYDHHFKEGTYVCKGCGTPLFSSETKYNSGCGWPAFYQSIDNKIDETPDGSLGMIRTEITCKKCEGHLGHVFNDGPQPTGVRYCVNSTSMDFIPTANSAKTE